MAGPVRSAGHRGSANEHDPASRRHGQHVGAAGKTRMSRRWIIVSTAVAVLAVIAFFPLRLALGLSDLKSIGFTARQVEGSIWSGRIGELHMRSQPLGTVDVALDPFALLIGNISMSFSRLGSPEGPLDGRLVAGF